MLRGPSLLRHALLILIATFASLLAAAMLVDTPLATSVHVSVLTADGGDRDLVLHRGLRAVLRGRVSEPLAPLIDSWENAALRSRQPMLWCLEGSRDAEFASIVREALDWFATRYPGQFFWQERCPGNYTIGDDAARDCGTAQAVACAVYFGPTRGHISINPAFTAGRPRVKRIAIAHEIQHIVATIGHTGCGSVPDSDPSIMSPLDLDRERPCHEPPAFWLNPHDLRRAEDRYQLQPGTGPGPTPTPTPSPPATGRITVRRWIRPDWGEACQPTIAGWCVDDHLWLTPRGAFLEILRDAHHDRFIWIAP